VRRAQATVQTAHALKLAEERRTSDAAVGGEDMTQTDPKSLLARFWRELGQLRTGMLGLVAEDEGHAQPMTAHFEGERGPLWFYAHRHHRMAQLAEHGHAAVFHYVGPGHDLYACVHGELGTSGDEAIIGRYWSDEVAQWYPGGQHDSDLALLKFTPSSAQIWLPCDGAQPQLFGLETYRAPPRDIHAEVRL
jgi:general stress protein 26